MPISAFTMPYPDFVYNTVINPDEFDSNNLAISNKLNELITASNNTAPLSHVGAGGTAHANATTSVAGFMSNTDKTKLDSVATGANNYVHPATHPATIIVQEPNYRFVTDSQITTWNNKLDNTGTQTFFGSLTVSTNLTVNGTVSEGGTLLTTKYQPKYTTSAGAPSSTPTSVGLLHIDTSNKRAYISTGTTSSADWETIDNSATGVTSVAGRTGDVILVGNDITDATHNANANTIAKRDSSGNINFGKVLVTSALGGFYNGGVNASGSYVFNWASNNYFGIGARTALNDSSVKLGICDINGNWLSGLPDVWLGTNRLMDSGGNLYDNGTSLVSKFVKTDGTSASTVNETGYCGAGGYNRAATGVNNSNVAGCGVNFRIKRMSVPSSITFSAGFTGSTGQPNALSITVDGFWFFTTTPASGSTIDVYYNWRGNYTTA